jgi:hypothetical protein
LPVPASVLGARSRTLLPVQEGGDVDAHRLGHPPSAHASVLPDPPTLGSWRELVLEKLRNPDFGI